MFDTMPMFTNVVDDDVILGEPADNSQDYKLFQAEFSIDYNVSNILFMNSFYESIQYQRINKQKEKIKLLFVFI